MTNEPTREDINAGAEALSLVLLEALSGLDRLTQEQARGALLNLPQSDSILLEAISTKHINTGTPNTGRILRLAALGCIVDRARGLPVTASSKR